MSACTAFPCENVRQEGGNTNQKKLLETINSASNIKILETFLNDLRCSTNKPEDSKRLEAREALEFLRELAKRNGISLQAIDMVLSNSNNWQSVERTQRVHQVDEAMKELDELKSNFRFGQTDVLKSQNEEDSPTEDVDIKWRGCGKKNGESILADQQAERDAPSVDTYSDHNGSQTVEGMVENTSTGQQERTDRQNQRNMSDPCYSSDSDNPLQPDKNESALAAAGRLNQNHAQPGRELDSHSHFRSTKERELSKDKIIEQQAQHIRDLSNRLSQMAGNKLRDANPNIADLSDANRPTKLSERFSELYDNEWSDAFEELTVVQKDETTVIYHLLKVINKANQVCNSVKDEEIKTFKDTMTLPDLLDKNKATSCTTNIDELMTKEDVEQVKNILTAAGPGFKQAQRISSSASIPVLKEMFRQTMKTEVIKLSFPSAKTEAFEKYATKCIELVWMMLTQEPPMHLEGCPVGTEAPSYFREYTSKGNIVGALVWPALFLHKGGPLMNKGVVVMKWDTA